LLLFSGIGLDDAFIIIGSYERTDPSTEVTERIRETVDNIGMSIFLTSLTSVTAFALGSLSSVYAVGWLCAYAVPSVVLVFLYTITSFVALIVLDEQRIKDGRADCCVCLKLRQPTKTTDHDVDDPSPTKHEPFGKSTCRCALWAQEANSPF
jgi:Niemann-Pick C1 protein